VRGHRLRSGEPCVSAESTACGFSQSVRPGIIQLSLPALDRATTDNSPEPDEESVSYCTVIPCRMPIAMRHLLRLRTIFLRCIAALFRSRSKQAIVALALRQQLATFADKGRRPRICPGRPGLLGPSLPSMVGVERNPGHRPARNRGSLASQGLPAVLAIHFEARSWTTSNSGRSAGSHSSAHKRKWLAFPKGPS
jgi:hypothetical protein